MSTKRNYHTVQDCSPEKVLGRVDEAICALDDDWQFTFVNEEAAAMLDRQPEELLGEDIRTAFSDRDESLVAEKLGTAMETQTPVRFDSYDEFLEKWFKIRLYPSADGVTACFSDITDGRGEQLELQRKRRLFETVFEETEDALVVADTDRRITDFNPAAERLFGYDAADVLGETSRMLYADPASYNQQGEKRFNTAAEEGTETYIVAYERADGTTFEGETLGTSLKGPDGETLAFLGSIRDVSDRLAHEQEIEARNVTLRRFHEIATDDATTFEEQVTALLELGREQLNLDTGIVVDSTRGRETVEYALGAEEYEDPVQTVTDLMETAPEGGEIAADNATADIGTPHDVASYIGAPLLADGDRYGTLAFWDTTPRDGPYTEGERNFVRLFAQWLGKEMSRQEVRERAAANRQRLRQIIDMLPQLVFAKDRSGEFLLANEALAEAYGTTVEDIEGATDADFAESEAEAKQFREDDIAVIESGDRKNIPEEPLTTADGTEKVFQTTKIPYDPVETDKEAVLGVATDITERKERERELERQSAAMEASMDGISILDADGEYVYMNQAHADVFDYEPDELLGSTWQRLYGEDEFQRIEQEIFPELEREGEWRGETIGRTSDGSTVHQEITLSSLDDGGLICTNRDITEQKERRRELERQRTRLRALFDESPDGIVIHDDTGRVIDVNDTQSQLLGYDVADLQSMNVAEFEVGISRAELRDLWDEMAVGEILKVEGNHRKQNGETFPVEVWVNKLVVDGEQRYIAVSRDITERKQRERRLQKFEQMVEHAGHAFFFTDVDGTIQYVNPAFEEMTGYSEADAVGQTPDLLNSGEHDEAFFAELWETVLAGNVWTGEITNERKTGETFVSSHVVAPVEDDDGTITNFVAVYEDITERKARERELRESREALRNITAIGSDTGLDFDAKLDAILELGCDHLGLPFGFLNRIEEETQHVVEATGTHPLLQAGESAPLSKAYCRQTIERDEVLDVTDAVDEGWGADPAYEEFGLGCYIGGKVIVDGDLYGTLCFADSEARSHEFDETERAFVELLVQWISYELASDAFETKLQKMNDTAQQLMEAPTKADIAALMTDSAKSVLGMSMTGVWWYDEDAPALVPETQTDESTAIVGDQPRFEPGDSLAWQAFDAGEVSVYDDLRDVAGPYNEATELRSEVIVPLGDHGIIIASSTEPRSFSDADLNLLEVLSATVESALTRAQREEQLRETQRQLKQSNQELEQFAYAASHDLQEPLRTVSSYLTLLDRRYGDNLDEDAADFIEIAVDGADRMREMIQALLEYSRVDTQGESFESVATTTVFDRVTQNLAMTIQESDATVSAPDTELLVHGDSSQLTQLFQNLIDNGIKYNDDTPRVDVSATAEGEMVRFDVTDNGIGIEPDQTEEIFEVFQRMHTREEFEGTGIGLSLCRKIVDRHGGDIAVDSEPGEGTTFTIRLPRADTADE